MAQVGTAQVGIAQVGTAQVGTAQVGTAQVGTAQVGTAQVGIAQVGTAPNSFHNRFVDCGFLFLVFKYDRTRPTVADFDFNLFR